MKTGTWQTVAAVLGVAAAVLIGVFIVMLLADPPRPTPTASPSLIAVASPSLGTPVAPTSQPTASPTELPTASPVGTTVAPPTASPLITPSVPPTASPAPTVGPTVAASPTVLPTAAPTATSAATAPLRQIRFTDLGLDAPDAPENPTERFVTFSTDGPGQISAALSDVSFGRVRLCLWRGDRATVSEQECRNARTGGLERSVSDAGRVQWTVSLIGATEQVSPTATLLVSFNTLAPSVTIDRFRFQGQAIENYNGLVAEVEAAADGELSLDANWENPDDERFPYEMLVEEIGSPAPPFVAEGSVTTATQHSAPVEMGVDYRVTFANSSEVANVEVFLRATLTWP